MEQHLTAINTKQVYQINMYETKNQEKTRGWGFGLTLVTCGVNDSNSVGHTNLWAQANSGGDDVLGLVCHFPEQVAKPDQLNYVHQVPFSLLFE